MDSISKSQCDVQAMRHSTCISELTFIRPFEFSDCEKMKHWGVYEDPLYHIFNRTSHSPDWYELFYKRGQTQTAMRFAVERNHKLIGYMTLYNINAELGIATLGINFDPNEINKGYGTSALKALIKLYFMHGFTELRLELNAFNKRALHCYQKCGFKITGTAWDSESALCSLDIFHDDAFEQVRPYFRMNGNRIELLKILMSRV